MNLLHRSKIANNTSAHSVKWNLWSNNNTLPRASQMRKSESQIRKQVSSHSRKWQGTDLFPVLSLTGYTKKQKLSLMCGNIPEWGKWANLHTHCDNSLEPTNNHKLERLKNRFKKEKILGNQGDKEQSNT